MTQKRIFIIAAVAIIIYVIYASFGSHRYHQTKWLDLTFKARVLEKIKTPRLTYYRFTKNDSIFELKDQFTQDFKENVEIGDSVYKIKGINYCIIFSKNGSIKPSKF